MAKVVAGSQIIEKIKMHLSLVFTPLSKRWSKQGEITFRGTQ